MISEHVAECLDNALLVTIEGASHDGPFTSQAEVEGQILFFLDLVD